MSAEVGVATSEQQTSQGNSLPEPAHLPSAGDARGSGPLLATDNADGRLEAERIQACRVRSGSPGGPPSSAPDDWCPTMPDTPRQFASAEGHESSPSSRSPRRRRQRGQAKGEGRSSGR